jgi:hypothetical protein
MSDIHRRNFLFGTVAAAASGTALVLTAPKEALSLFQPTLKETLALTRAPTLVRYDPLDIGETLYNAKGTPVALVTSLHVETDHDPVETTMFGDATRSLAFGGAFGGSMRLHIEAEGRFDTVTELHTAMRRHHHPNRRTRG